MKVGNGVFVAGSGVDVLDGAGVAVDGAVRLVQATASGSSIVPAMHSNAVRTMQRS